MTDTTPTPDERPADELSAEERAARHAAFEAERAAYLAAQAEQEAHRSTQHEAFAAEQAAHATASAATGASGQGYGIGAPSGPGSEAWGGYPTGAPAPSPADTAQAKAAQRAQAAQERARARAEAAQVRAAAAREQAAARTLAAQQRAAEAHARAVERSQRPITKGAGAATVGIVMGVLLIAGALLLAANRSNLSLPWPFDGSYDPALAWFGVALVVIGAAIVISGIRGRSSGGLGFLAIVGLVIAVPWSLAANDSPFERVDASQSWREVSSRAVTVSEGTTAPRSVAEAERGFRAHFGEPTVDLSGLDLSDATTDDPIVVPIEMTAGDLTVRVPQDVAVEADVRLWAGQIKWDVDETWREYNRFGGGTAALTSDEAVDDGAVLRLVLSVRAGNVTITEN